MKKAVLLVATFALFAMVVGVVAQDKANVSGTWQLTQPGRNGDVTQTLTLDQKGGDITGTMKAQNGDVPVTGTISGSDITLNVKRTTQNGEVTNVYKGTVTGDTMKGMVTMGQRTVEWSATKGKS
jgi:hypothetical protein